MLTQAARRFSITRSAMRSAAARSGRLVNTNSVRMREPLVNGWITKLESQNLFYARVVQAPRLAHEIVRFGERGARHARRPRQASGIGDQVQPVAHLHARVVARVVETLGRLVLQRAAGDRGEVVGMDVVGVDVVLGAQHRTAGAQALEWQSVGSIDTRRAQHDETYTARGAPCGKLPLRIRAPLRARGA